MSLGLVAEIVVRWNAFWYAPVPPHRMALFRLAFGIYLVAYFASLAPHVEVYFSNQGVYVPYLVPDWAPDPPLAWALYGAMFLGAVALTLGLWPRVAATATLILFAHHYFLQLATKQSSFERLIFIYLWVLVLAESHHALAPGIRSPAEQTVPAWPERILRCQTVLLYLGAALWKAASPSWHSGALLYATLQGMWATPFAFWIVRQGFGEAAWTTATFAIIGFELALALALLWRRTRVAAVVAGTAFHVINCIVLTIPEFLLCLAPYAVFLPPEWLQRRLSPRGMPSPSRRPDRAD